MISLRRTLSVLAILFLTSTAGARQAPTHVSAAVEAAQRTAEGQIRRMLEPLLEKYCHDQCKLLGVNVTAEVTLPEETAPGFDDAPPADQDAIAPTSARIKLLFDEKIGPVSRRKLLELMQQYLDTLDYPVRVDSQQVRFPEVAGSEGRVAELRDRLARGFQNGISELLQQYCPERCLLTDFNLKTEPVNAEETQYGAPGEFMQDGSLALRIRDISGTILMDESLPAEERASILAMAKLKTSTFHNVSLTAKAMRFPKPGVSGAEAGDEALGPDGLVREGRKGIHESSTSKNDNNSTSDSKSKIETQQTSNSASTDTRTSNQTTDQSNKTSTTANNSNSDNSRKTENSQTTESNQRQERFERFEKVERVESGDAVQVELRKFMVYALIFGCSVLSLLLFIAVAGFRSRKEMIEVVNRGAAAPPAFAAAPSADASGALEEGTGASSSAGGRHAPFIAQFEAARLRDELLEIFAQSPKVTKYVFTRVLTEEGIEVTAQYMHIFGETIMIEMLRDPSMQSDLNELLEYYAKTPVEFQDAEKLELLRRLHQRTVSGKLAVMGNRSSGLFEFLAEMDGTQVLEMIRTESLTVKSIVLTQCDAQKRSLIYNRLDEETRLKLLTELSRIDYLPRDYIFNVANALKRKRRENPRLNTEALPGSEVLVSLLERTHTGIQRDVVKTLEATNPDSARTVKGKLISLETLRYLRDGQLLEVVLSLKHDELLQFMKGAPESIRQAILDRAPPELSGELADELAQVPAVSRENYSVVERKVMNRMKLMANDGLINLVETNERMFTQDAAANGEMTNWAIAQNGTIAAPPRGTA